MSNPPRPPDHWQQPGPPPAGPNGSWGAPQGGQPQHTWGLDGATAGGANPYVSGGPNPAGGGYGYPAGGPGPVQPQYGPAEYGSGGWAMGLISLLPIPFFNLLIAGIAQWVAGLRDRKHGGVAAQNGARAASWGVTQLLWFPLLAIDLALIPVLGTPSGGGGYRLAPVHAGISFGLIGLYLLLSIVTLIYAIVGMVEAKKGKVVKLPVIPFFKAR